MKSKLLVLLSTLIMTLGLMAQSATQTTPPPAADQTKSCPCCNHDKADGKMACCGKDGACCQGGKCNMTSKDGQAMSHEQMMSKDGQAANQCPMMAKDGKMACCGQNGGCCKDGKCNMSKDGKSCCDGMKCQRKAGA